MAEVPTASFPSAEKSKSTGLREKIPSIGRSPEDKRIQRETKDRQRELRTPIPKATVDRLKAERQKNGLGLNIQEDQNFKDMVRKQEEAMLQNPSLAVGLRNGNLGPSQKAEAATLAYAEFSTAYPKLAEQYARDGIHLTGPDKTGGYRPDVNADPFWRAAQEQARVLRAQGDIDGARQIVDDFALKYRTKAELYGANGAKELEEAVKRVGSRTPDTNANVVAAQKTPETVTIQSPASEQVRRLNELAAKGDQLSLRELNEQKQLMNHNKQAIDAARDLRIIGMDPTGRPLTDAELAQVEVYEAFLNTQDRALATANTTATTETQAQRQQREAIEYQKTRGPQAFGELSSKGVDFTKDEQAAMQTLKQKGWTEDPDTLKYIHAGFAEHQRQQAEAAFAGIPQGTIDQLAKDKGLSKDDILGVLLAALASGIISSIPKIP